MMKILLVFGTRPEAIKMAPLVKEFQKFPEQFETKVCVTAQHREMLDQVLQLFEIIPDYDLNIMKAGQDLNEITSRVLLGMRNVLDSAQPDLVLVHGDTSTSTAAALAAFYKKIAVGHIEAGLRTYNIYSPWPEEINRQLTSRIAKYHFAPTNLSKKNLLKENIEQENIFVTGNTVIDALFWVNEKIKNFKDKEEDALIFLEAGGISRELYFQWKNRTRKLILITGHRRENFGDGFLNICNAIKELAIKFQNVDFVYPMHLNPNVRNSIQQIFGDVSRIKNNFENSNLFFIEPLDYLPFVALMNNSYLILTDSGGIQEEGPGLGKPVLVMRETSERPEALEAGTVRLVGTNRQRIIEEVVSLIEDDKHYNFMSQAHNPYGDGRACKNIVEIFNKLT